MKEGQTDFLDEFEAQDAALSQQPEPQGEASRDVSRDDKGRFAPKSEPEQVQQGDKPEPVQAGQEPEPPSEQEGSHVPVSALKAERAKRQALEAELAKFRQPAATPQVQPQSPKSPEFVPPALDWDEDPQHYVQAQIHSMKMEQSKFFAVQQSSEQAVADAWAAFDAACEKDAALSAYSGTLINHPHPMGEVLKWHKKQQQLQALDEVGDLDKYRERVIAEYLAAQQGQAPAAGAGNAQRQAPKPAIPPSLANGGAGGVPVPANTDDDGFNSFFAESHKPRKR